MSVPRRLHYPQATRHLPKQQYRPSVTSAARWVTRSLAAVTLYISRDVERTDGRQLQVAPSEKATARTSIGAACVRVSDIGREDVDVAPGGLLAGIGDQRAAGRRRQILPAYHHDNVGDIPWKRRGLVDQVGGSVFSFRLNSIVGSWILGRVGEILG